MTYSAAFSQAIGRLQLSSRHISIGSASSHSGEYPTTRSVQLLSTRSKMASTSNVRAPWRDLLASHMAQTPGYEFTVATVGQDENKRPVPRVRTCGYRGFFPELEIHPKSQEEMKQQVKDGGNPPTYESDMFCFTTDTRMEKLGQLESSGNDIEAVFWLKDLMTQWRVKGKAFAIGDPTEDAEHEKISRSELEDFLRVKQNFNGPIEEWTWERAVTKYFANHSPLARGSFKNPAPGQPRSQLPSDPSLRMGQKVNDLHDPVARGNFRVVVIRPDVVERLDLSSQEDMRRWIWVLNSRGDHYGQYTWTETEVWP